MWCSWRNTSPRRNASGPQMLVLRALNSQGSADASRDRTLFCFHCSPQIFSPPRNDFSNSTVHQNCVSKEKLQKTNLNRNKKKIIKETKIDVKKVKKKSGTLLSFEIFCQLIPSIQVFFAGRTLIPDSSFSFLFFFCFFFLSGGALLRHLLILNQPKTNKKYTDSDIKNL